MKNYALLGHDNEKDFIINYQKSNNKIIINYANGDKEKLEYTKELEILILEAMKEQVLNSKSYYQKLKWIINDNENMSKKFAAISGIGIGGLVSSTTFETLIINNGIINGVLTIVGLGGTFLLVMLHNEINKIIDDIEKNIFFIENEELFQTLTECNGFYTTTKEDTKNFIKTICDINKEKKDPSFPNLNDIDQISYDTILEAYDLIKKNQEFSKFYEDTSKVRKKSLNKNDN